MKVCPRKMWYRGHHSFSCGLHLVGTLVLGDIHRTLRTQLPVRFNKPHNSAVPCQCSNHSNNKLSCHLVGTIQSVWFQIGSDINVILDHSLFAVCYLQVKPLSGKWIQCFNLPVPLACNELRLIGSQLRLRLQRMCHNGTGTSLLCTCIYTAKLLFHHSPTRHSDYYCDDVATVL